MHGMSPLPVGIDDAGGACEGLEHDRVVPEEVLAERFTADGRYGIVAAGRTDHQMDEMGGDAKLVKLDAQFDIAGCTQLTSVEVTSTEGIVVAEELADSEAYETHCSFFDAELPATIEPVSESIPLCREEANLRFHQQTDTPDPVGIGEVVTYTIVLTSAGLETATGVVLTDRLHAWQRATGVTSSRASCAIVDPGWGGTVVCTPGAMAGARSRSWTRCTARRTRRTEGGSR